MLKIIFIKEGKRKIGHALKGRKLPKAHKENIKLGQQNSPQSTLFKNGQHISPQTEFKKGNKIGKLGYKFPKGHQLRKGLPSWNKGLRMPQFSRENHPNWLGGKSFAPYPPTFNQQLKDRVRVRDNFICQLCGKPELEENTRLAVHHIDYIKKNCNINNLIALCRICNNKVNRNRKHWKEYFAKKLSIS